MFQIGFMHMLRFVFLCIFKSTSVLVLTDRKQKYDLRVPLYKLEFYF